MSEALWQVLTYVTIPAIATIVGGVIAAFRRPSERTSSYIQHFAPGVVFAAVALEFLPELRETPDPLAIAAGFASGTALMLLVRWLRYCQLNFSGRRSCHPWETQAVI